MADDLNSSRNPDEQVQGDESQRDRSKQQQAGSKNKPDDEQTDTLEDRNLSGSSTWATLPEQENEDSSDDDSTSNR